jgi:hypothetical protein
MGLDPGLHGLESIHFIVRRKQEHGRFQETDSKPLGGSTPNSSLGKSSGQCNFDLGTILNLQRHGGSILKGIRQSHLLNDIWCDTDRRLEAHRVVVGIVGQYKRIG